MIVALQDAMGALVQAQLAVVGMVQVMVGLVCRPW